MESWFHDLLASGVEHNATEWQILLDKPAVLRIDGSAVKTDLVADNDTFVRMLSELLPPKQYEKITTDDDGVDFVNENFLYVDEELGRFLLNLQRQRNQLALIIRRPRREPSVLFDALKYAVEHGASDLHVRENKFIRLRIDGKLVETDFMTDSHFFKRAINEIVPEGQLHKYIETGDYDFAWEEEGIGRFRVNLHRQRGDSAFTLRYVKSKAPTVREVGLPEVLKTIVSARNGIIFVSGTTGCGKSTTMAAMLDHVNNTSEQHVITIEDPIEYTFQDNRSFFEQREIGLDAESFESALIHALRQDPDIIMVGEMRNRTTFETALTAAETGHMVITTLHTKNAPQSLTRILDMYPMEERDTVRKGLADCLRAVICQRLAPRAIGKGVVPVVEILINTPIVRKLIFDNKLEKLPQAIEGGGDDNMVSFNGSLHKLVNNGDITEETAMRFSDNPQELKMRLKGIKLSEGGGIIQ
ncbi:MAG TPA: PilT/PilU family type 4a pilus ATPase [Lentisphaeria bacterium]|nr:PilT/PilU family type 4a pilus ATPase [Lentisphaeria bacterium]